MLRCTLSLFVGAALLGLPETAAAQQPDPAMIARGAQLYGQICSRCHNPRGANERTDGEWSLIVLHMRSRATMSRSDADAVIAFLQATNVPENRPPALPASAPSRALEDRASSAERGTGGPTFTSPRWQAALWRYMRAYLGS